MASSCGEDASKNALRDAYLTLRAGLTPRQRGRLEAQVVRHLTELEAYRSADLLLAYVAYRDEMDTRAMCERAWADGKSVALPRCEGGERSLAFYVVDTLEGLAPVPAVPLSPSWTTATCRLIRRLCRHPSAWCRVSCSTRRAIVSAMGPGTTTTSWQATSAPRWASCMRCRSAATHFLMTSMMLPSTCW